VAAPLADLLLPPSGVELLRGGSQLLLLPLQPEVLTLQVVILLRELRLLRQRRQREVLAALAERGPRLAVKLGHLLLQ
jgi:hypothetical protein